MTNEFFSTLRLVAAVIRGSWTSKSHLVAEFPNNVPSIGQRKKPVKGFVGIVNVQVLVWLTHEFMAVHCSCAHSNLLATRLESSTVQLTRTQPQHFQLHESLVGFIELMSGFARDLYARCHGYRTDRAILSSSTYDRIPLASTNQVLHAAHPISMEYLRDTLSEQQRGDVYKHVVAIVERSDAHASYLEAANITMNTLFIHIEDASYPTTTTDTSTTTSGTILRGRSLYGNLYVSLDFPHNNVDDQTTVSDVNSTAGRADAWNSSIESGQGPPSIPSSRSDAESSLTVRGSVMSTPSSSRHPRRQPQAYVSSPHGVGDVPAATCSNSVESELTELDKRLNELGGIIDEHEEHGAFKDARKASRSARQSILQARLTGANNQTALLEARAKTIDAERIAEEKLTDLAMRASMSSPNRATIPHTLPEQSRGAAVIDRNSTSIPSYPPPPYQTVVNQGPTYHAPIYHPPIYPAPNNPAPIDSATHSPVPHNPTPHNPGPAEQPRARQPLSSRPEPEANNIYYHPRLHLPIRADSTPMLGSGYHLIGRNQNKVCRCLNHMSHRGHVNFVIPSDIRAPCKEFFRRYPMMDICTKDQWREVQMEYRYKVGPNGIQRRRVPSSRNGRLEYPRWR